jgi:protein SCO1/2
MHKRTYAIAAGLLTAGLLGGLAAFVVTQGAGDRYAHCTGGEVAGNVGGPFTLVSETGETVTEAEVLSRPSIIYFGYTFCPDVCPLDTVRNAEAVEILAERGFDVQPVFISIDPDRDTPEVVRDFTDAIHPDMLGLTGSPEQVRAASQAYRTFYSKQEGDPEYYLVDHSTLSYFVLPGEGVVAFFRRELTGEQLADRMACFLEARG